MHRKDKRRVILDRRRAITYAVETAKKGDILLLVGKGHETYELSEGREAPLCEKEIVLSALKARRKKENYANQA
jgi:UDP-N-acetylmuramoyl-L-alanyl-D-glutamate--2,6-diaminopimelate ligase